MDAVVQTLLGTDGGAISGLSWCLGVKHFWVRAAQHPLWEGVFRTSGLSAPLTLGKVGRLSGSKSRNPVLVSLGNS